MRAGGSPDSPAIGFTTPPVGGGDPKKCEAPYLSINTVLLTKLHNFPLSLLLIPSYVHTLGVFSKTFAMGLLDPLNFFFNFSALVVCSNCHDKNIRRRFCIGRGSSYLFDHEEVAYVTSWFTDGLHGEQSCGGLS